MMYWGHVTIVWCFVATCTCVVLAEAIPIDMFYPFGPKHGDRALAKGFVERSERLRVEEGFNYLGSRFYNVWITTDGYLALDHLTNRFATEIKPFPSKGDGAIIAPYLADADTSGVGNVYYRQITNPTDSTLRAISKDIDESNFKEFADVGFQAKMAIVATWHQVGYFHNHTDKNNTFQVALATNNGNTVAVFNYLDDGLNWYQADEDYYDYTEDDPDVSPVQVGFNKGGEGDIFYTLSEFTMTPDVLKLDNYSNRDKQGQWTFSITDEDVTVGEVAIIATGKNGNSVHCGRSVSRCLQNNKCSIVLQQFQINCNNLMEKKPECTSSCIQSVTQLMNNKRGRNVWFCTRHHNIYSRLRRHYKKKCQPS